MKTSSGEFNPKFSEMYEIKVRALAKSNAMTDIIEQRKWILTASSIGLVLERQAFNGQRIILTYEEYQDTKDLDAIIALILVRLNQEADKEILRDL